MEGEPDYLELLDYIYQTETAIVLVPGHLGVTGNKETYQEQKEMYDAGHVPYEDFSRRQLHQLKEVNLVEEYDTAGDEQTIAVDLPEVLESVRLTERGFNVAHERALRQRQLKLAEEQSDANSTVAVFTVILGGSAIVQALAEMLNFSGVNQLILMAAFVSAVTALLYTRTWWLPSGQSRI